METVHVNAIVALELVFAVPLPTNLVVHINTIGAGSSLDEGPIEEITVVRRDDRGTSFFDMQEKPLQDCLLIRLVEDHERAGIFWLRGIIKVGNILRDDFSVGDQKPLAVNHVGYHHNLIDGGVWEF